MAEDNAQDKVKIDYTPEERKQFVGPIVVSIIMSLFVLFVGYTQFKDNDSVVWRVIVVALCLVLISAMLYIVRSRIRDLKLMMIDERKYRDNPELLKRERDQ